MRNAAGRYRRPLTLTLLLLLSLGQASWLGAQESSARTQSTDAARDASTDLERVPQLEIPARATETLLQLRAARGRMESAGVSPSDLEARVELFASELAGSRDVPPGELEALGVDRLIDLRGEWQRRGRELEAVRLQVDRRADALDRELVQVEQWIAVWEATEEHLAAQMEAGTETAEPAARDVALSGLLARTRDVLARLRLLRADLLERLSLLVSLADRIVAQELELENYLDELVKIREQARLRLFRQDSPPFHRLLFGQVEERPVSESVAEVWRRDRATLVAFLQQERPRVILHLAFFLLVLSILLVLRWRVRVTGLEEEDRQSRPALHLLDRPFSTAVIVALVASVWFYGERPLVVRQTTVLIGLLPLARVLPGMLPPSLRGPAYALLTLTGIELLRPLMLAGSFPRRSMTLMEALLGLLVVFWTMVVTRRQRGAPETRAEMPVGSGLWRPVAWLLPVAGLTLMVSLVASLVGSNALAEAASALTIVNAGRAGAFYLAAVAASAILLVLVSRRPLRDLHLVGRHHNRLAMVFGLGCHAIGVYLWLRVALESFGLLEDVRDWLRTVLGDEWTIGTVELTLGSVLGALLIFLGSLLLARVLRSVLDEEILVRFPRGRGWGGAISMVGRYFIVFVGFLLALSALGIDLGSFGVAAGALGLGLGFGLQNVIANFVSGLILAFERPVQKSDVVQFGGLFGRIEEIGVRSTRVKTFDGAEVIVPNSNLISSELTNWTLSDERRRKVMAVEVAQGPEPREVTDLLASVTAAVEGVLDEPRPLALFDGYGDSSLKFRVLYWLHGSQALTLPSEVALSVHEALVERGIDPPTPRRHLVIVDEERSAEPSPGVGTPDEESAR